MFPISGDDDFYEKLCIILPPFQFSKWLWLFSQSVHLVMILLNIPFVSLSTRCVWICRWSECQWNHHGWWGQDSSHADGQGWYNYHGDCCGGCKYICTDQVYFTPADCLKKISPFSLEHFFPWDIPRLQNLLG